MYKGMIMETAPTDDLFDSPRHPYTQSLLAAIPEPDPDLKKQAPLQNDEPLEAAEPPEGCLFRDRCPDAQSCPADARLPMIEVGPSHHVRCWKMSDEGKALYQ
jgi:peptide/nickel transport system ATP-binding protein